MNKFATFMRESGPARFLIPAGIIMIIVSVFMFIIMNNTKDYVRTDATVTKVELQTPETRDDRGETVEATYKITVKYMVDGKEYEGILEEMPQYKEGQRFVIAYNPANPLDIVKPGGFWFAIFFAVAGVACIVFGIISIIAALGRRKRMKEQEERWANGEDQGKSSIFM